MTLLERAAIRFGFRQTTGPAPFAPALSPLVKRRLGDSFRHKFAPGLLHLKGGPLRLEQPALLLNGKTEQFFLLRRAGAPTPGAPANVVAEPP